MRKVITLLIIILVSVLIAKAQRQDRIWCFGYHAGIDFNDSLNPLAFDSQLEMFSSISNASISDANGNLLFYAAGIDFNNFGGKVYNQNFQLMDNGDSLAGHPYAGTGFLIIPFPNDTSLYYLFAIQRHSPSGAQKLYYSVINMENNGGLGRVISKNIFLNLDTITEKLTAVKHANGRDWWLLVLKAFPDSFCKFLITPDGISGPYFQPIGSPVHLMSPFGQLIFSNDGNKLLSVGANSFIDLFDFDRCTGIISNFRDLSDHVLDIAHQFYGCSFSPDGTKIYVSPFNLIKSIFQFDLNATNIAASKQLIFNYPDTGSMQNIQMGLHQLGPDGRIYIAKGTAYGGINSDTYNTHHMDVILNPDSLGSSCNYQPNYFDLGPGRTIGGLPNMPNYNLGPVTGSICDSLTGINKQAELENGIEVYPNPSGGVFYLRLKNATQTGDKIVSVTVTDLIGSEILQQKSFSSTLDISNKSSGVYFVQVITQKHKSFVAKVIKE